MPFPRLLLCACLTFATAMAAAQVPEFEDDANAVDAARADAMRAANETWQRRNALALAASGRARDLALASLLLQVASSSDAPADAMPDYDSPSRDVPVDPRVAIWRQQAAANAGSDVLANAMLAGARSKADGEVVAAAAAARWRAAEPDNLAPLLFADGDADDLLTAASGARRFDLHVYDLTRAIAAALRGQRPDAAERAVLLPDGVPEGEFLAVTASGMVQAFVIPSMATLVEACRGAALDVTPSRRDDCRRVAETLRDRSDTSLGESLGLSMLRGLATTPAEVAAADARGRQFAWRMQQWQAIAAGQPRDGLGEFARLVADPSIARESQLIDRVITGAGAPLTPPAGWEQPRQR